MALKDVIGQERALRILSGTLRRDRVPSAMLFSGDSGIGKRLAAINYAKAINCMQPKGFDCCDECVSCRKIDSATHPDVLTITLESVEDALSLKEKTGKDKNRYEYPIEAVHKIEEILYLSPYEGRKKIIIIDDADVMNINAANAFLKTLEEPPPDSLIILISANPDRLPDTIRSRCVNIKFYPLPLDGCKGVMSEHIDGKDMDFVLNLAMGRPGLAVSMDLVKERERFTGTLNNMIRGESKDAWADKGEINSWLDTVSVLLRDMVVYGISGKETDLILGNRQSIIGVRREAKDILDAYQEMQRLKGLLDFNLNKSISWNYVSTIMKGVMEV
ncbi:MAG TPA: hypothetical protein DHV16_08660 [Nitrospiraceae bacterium]|nr:hypothetical protein [Nitrospiraceae bacterium]